MGPLGTALLLRTIPSGPLNWCKRYQTQALLPNTRTFFGWTVGRTGILFDIPNTGGFFWMSRICYGCVQCQNMLFIINKQVPKSLALPITLMSIRHIRRIQRKQCLQDPGSSQKVDLELGSLVHHSFCPNWI